RSRITNAASKTLLNAMTPSITVLLPLCARDSAPKTLPAILFPKRKVRVATRRATYDMIRVSWSLDGLDSLGTAAAALACVFIERFSLILGWCGRYASAQDGTAEGFASLGPWPEIIHSILAIKSPDTFGINTREDESCQLNLRDG